MNTITKNIIFSLLAVTLFFSLIGFVTYAIENFKLHFGGVVFLTILWIVTKWFYEDHIKE